MTDGTKSGHVGKEDRKRDILEVLVDSGLALPASVVWRNQKARGGSAERRTVARLLKELIEDGYVKKVDPDELADGRYVEIDQSASGYFMATESAYDALSVD